MSNSEHSYNGILKFDMVEMGNCNSKSEIVLIAVVHGNNIVISRYCHPINYTPWKNFARSGEI